MMYKRFTFIISALLLLFLVSESARSELVAWYKLDGNGNDSSGNNWHGTEQSGPLTYISGIHGKAVQLNGTDQFIVTEATADVLNIEDAKPKTICAWVNNGSDSTTGSVWDISSTSNRMGQGQTFSLRGNNAANSWMVQLWSMDENPTGMVDTIGTWTHIAFSYDGTTLTVYSDGNQVFSGDKALALGTENAFRIGQFYDPGGTTYYFTGSIDDVQVYDNALTQEEVQAAMEGVSENVATNPKPENELTDVALDIILSWAPGIIADIHNVFIGTNADDVNDATLTEPLGVTLVEELDVNSFDPGALDYGTTYFWRVDEVNAPDSPGEYKGSVWSFMTEPYAYKLPAENITVTAISSRAGSDPNSTINESGLDANDTHSNNTVDMWLSSGTDTNDVWIQYDFDKLYKLHQMLIWNYNGGFWYWYAGFNEVTVDYSTDGENWETLDGVSTFPMAPGDPGYAHDTTIDFDGIKVMSVRITSHSNHGVWPNHGLSEVRFTYIPVRARKPEPEVGATDVSVDADLSWRKGREASEHDVYIDTDEQAVTDGTADVDTVGQASYSQSLELGKTYFWRVDEVNDAEEPAVWVDGIWNFTTQEYLMIESFEDYNNYDEDSDDAIWWTWIDGYLIDDNGALISHNLPPFCEQNIVQDGKWSAPLYYDNTGTANKSEIERTFSQMLNLTSNGADTFRLYYHGQISPFTVSGDSIAMSGTGSDLYTTTEQHQFAYKTLTGDGSITVRIDSMGGGGTYPKAGIMIRSGLEDGAPLASLFREDAGAGAAYFRNRTEQGNNLANASGASLAMPLWLRLTRSGTTITAETSDDGITWGPFSDDGTEPTTAEITMDNEVCIGLFISANSNTTAAGAIFSNVAISGNVTGGWTETGIGYLEDVDIANTLDTLYIRLTDSNNNTAKVQAPELAVFSLNWTEWLIPYSDFVGVDMTKIKKIAIGIGDPADSIKGKGLVYIDNIGYGHSIQ